MALINDPDQLSQSSQAASGVPDGEVYINTAAKTIELIPTTSFPSGNLVAADGVTLQALYSFLKEEWKTDTNLIKYEFPMEAITSEQFEFINGWTLTDATVNSRKYVRTGGWAEKNTSNVVISQYMSVITLGTFASAGHTAYYAWDGDTAKTDFTFSGPVNEAIQIYSDPNGDGSTADGFNYTSTNLTVYIRPAPSGTSGSVEGYTYDLSTTTAIGATTVTYQAYRFPLSSTIDLDIELTDAEVASLISADSHTITWYPTEQNSTGFLTTDLNGGPYLYSIVMDNTDATGVTPTQMYNIEKYWLRQTGDIDSNTTGQYGVLTPELTTFVGPTLKTLDIDSADSTAGGVLVGNVDENFLANFQMTDNSGTIRLFPSLSTGTITFNANLYNDPAAHYWMFFDNAGGNEWPGANAIIVNDNSATPINRDLHRVLATPTTGPNSDDDTGGAVGATTAGSSTMSMAGTNWTADDFNNTHVLVIESGLNAGYYDITDTTTTTLVVDPPFEATDSSMAWRIVVKNTTGLDSYNFDYTNNVQGGRTGATDAPVWIVALGLSTGQYVAQSGTIGEGPGQNFSVTAALERNYSDPT